ncbi:MAG: hypothetical protein GHCLOJNM_00358 [bacterium]|nr:hypothetical protein [bacterium]
MSKASLEVSVADAHRFQVGVSLLLLVAVCATFALVDLLAQDRTLEAWFRDRELEFREQANLVFPNNGYFVDFEDRMLLDELPHADYSHGGTYFFGSSNLKWGLMTWTLPEEQRRLVHNYGIGATNHTTQFQFIRYLVDHEGWLAAGGEKTHAVLAVCYRSAVEKGDFFPSLWTRHGFYSYNQERGITPRGIPRVLRNYRIDRERCAGFLSLAAKSAWWALWGREARAAPRDTTVYRARLVETIESTDWRKVMDQEVAELGRMLDYLRERGVRVSVALLPRVSWTHELPYPARYLEGVTRICRARSTPLLDLSALLPDEEFVDSSHVNLTGLRKQHSALMSFAGVPTL